MMFMKRKLIFSLMEPKILSTVMMLETEGVIARKKIVGMEAGNYRWNMKRVMNFTLFGRVPWAL